MSLALEERNHLSVHSEILDQYGVIVSPEELRGPAKFRVKPDLI